MSSLTIVRFLRKKWHLQYLFLLTVVVAVYSWVLFAFFQSRARFGNAKYNKAKQTGDAILKKADEIKWAIAGASRIIFWKNVCRHQAYQAVALFKYYKIPYQVLVGFKKNEEGLIIGHVWTMVEKQMITGICNPEEYTIVSRFEG